MIAYPSCLNCQTIGARFQNRNQPTYHGHIAARYTTTGATPRGPYSNDSVVSLGSRRRGLTLSEQDLNNDDIELHSWSRPLNAAADSGHLEVVKALLEEGAEFTIANKAGRTPLYSATRVGQAEIVKLLLEKGADFTVVNENGWTPLNAAASNGHLEVVKLLLEKGADFTAATKTGQTPLHSAANMGRLEVVKLLLEKDIGGS